MSSSETDYEKLFTKFYSDFFKFKSGKKTHLRCPGCQSNKRFIIDDDKLVYSCGPSSDPKCGKQYTINLPKYIHYRTLREIYEKNINGSLEYRKDDILQYDLSELSQKMDVKTELETQNKLIKESSDDLKRLIDDYTKSNGLDEYIEDLEKLSEMRYKNSIEKSKIMRSLNEDELSEYVDLEEDFLEEDLYNQIYEQLKVDIHPQKSGWAGTPQTLLELADEELLALEQDSEVREEKEAIRKAVKELEVVNEALNLEKETLSGSLKEANVPSLVYCLILTS